MTPDLATLTGSAPYLGNDFLHVGDGKALDIYYFIFPQTLVYIN